MELEQILVWGFCLEVQGLSGWWVQEFNLCTLQILFIQQHAKLNDKDLKDELAKISF